MLFIWHAFWQAPQCTALQGGADDKGRERQRGRRVDSSWGGREEGKSVPLSGAEEQQPFTWDVHLLVQCVLMEAEPPTMVHLDTLETRRLITGVLKCSCLVSQRFVRTALLQWHSAGFSHIWRSTKLSSRHPATCALRHQLWGDKTYRKN